ncbi:P-loop containing nucleoside triphosphate hydrolase protein [Baffinella frigidus]|nr:P-loop containing nucleoside triphosphate hydrolase protein [Cryptophyta sp. CCMP2293]
MRSLCLRRGKDLLKDSIPPRALSIVRVRLDQAHQEAYDAIFDSASALVNSLLGDGPQALLSQYSGVLECLLRLRQVCDSLSLLPPDRLQRAREVALEALLLSARVTGHADAEARRSVCDSLSLLPPDRLQRAREVALEVKRLTQKNAASGKAAPLNATEAKRLLDKLQKVLAAPLNATEAKRLLDKLQKVLVAPSAGEEGGQGSAFQGEAQAEKEDEQVFECAICLGDLEPSMARILRACSHAFCEYCIEKFQWGGSGLARVPCHAFCEYCIEKVAATAHGGHVACPMCRAPFQMSDILGATQLQLQVSALAAEEASAKEKQVQPEVAPEAAVPLEPIPLGNPPKVAALLQGLREEVAVDPTQRAVGLREEWAADPTQKAVVFSQFTGMLNIVQKAIKFTGLLNIVQKAIKEEFGEECCRIDGSMAVAQRGAHLERFSQEEGPRVILVSLKAGGQGITLTRANLVYMCDIWWNYSTEEQAMDRVHRIGQTRPTRVVSKRWIACTASN